MEEIDQVETSTTFKKGFFQHVFSVDADAKSTILNIVQYILIAAVPVIILNQLGDKIFSTADEKKGNVELLAEALGEIVFIFVGVFFIHRFVTFIPTYSKSDYGKLNLFNSILIFLAITISSNNDLSNKLKLLSSRVTELWDGHSENAALAGNINRPSIENVNIIQPIARPIASKHDPGVNFDQMYNGEKTGYEGMANIIHGGQDQMINKNQGCARDIRSSHNEQISAQYDNNVMLDQEPTAANEALGGGFGTSF